MIINESNDLNLTNFLYYFGWGLAFTGLLTWLAIGSVTYGNKFSNVFTPLYGFVFWWTGNQFWSSESTTFSGLLITLALLMIPLSIFSWMDGDTLASTRVLMELSLLFGSLLAIYNYPGFSFFISLVGFAIWAFSLDVMIAISDISESNLLSVDSKLLSLRIKRVTEVLGLMMILIAHQIDAQYPDHAFWLYLFGVTSSWIAMTGESVDSKLMKFIYGCVNLSLILIWAFYINRHIFLFWGVIGVNLYQVNSLEGGEPKYPKINYLVTYNLLIILTAWMLDRYSVTTPIIDLTFWMYLHGGFLFWTNQTVELIKSLMIDNHSVEEKNWLIFLFFNIIYIAISICLTRVIFLFCGLIGLMSYLIHFGRLYFSSALVFTGSLALLGILIMFFSHQIRTIYGI